MLHPVGKLPAAVYWRRRALVLLLLLSFLGGGGWIAVSGLQRWRASAGAPVPAAASTPLPTPALEQVVPALPGVRLPSAAGSTTAAGVPVPAGLGTAAAPCTDDMIALAVRAPATVAVRSTPVFQLVVTDTAPVPCVRDVAKGRQEIILLDPAGTRLWSSGDCAPDPAGDVRTLTPGQAVAFQVAWDGMTSDPTCAGPTVAPAAGHYVLRGRLGTKMSADAPLTLT